MAEVLIRPVGVVHDGPDRGCKSFGGGLRGSEVGGRWIAQPGRHAKHLPDICRRTTCIRSGDGQGIPVRRRSDGRASSSTSVQRLGAPCRRHGLRRRAHARPPLCDGPVPDADRGGDGDRDAARRHIRAQRRLLPTRIAGPRRHVAARSVRRTLRARARRGLRQGGVRAGRTALSDALASASTGCAM